MPARACGPRPAGPRRPARPARWCGARSASSGFRPKHFAASGSALSLSWALAQRPGRFQCGLSLRPLRRSSCSLAACCWVPWNAKDLQTGPRPGRRKSLGLRAWLWPRRGLECCAFLRLAILVLGHLFDDGRLAHSRAFRARKPGQFTHLVECVLNVMNIAMKLVDLGHDPLDRVFRALLVRQDEQVILGNNFISQANLVQEQLQTGLEPNALELELDGILWLDVEPIERGQVEDDRQAQLAAESLDDIGQRRGPGEPERIRFQKRVLDRVG